MNLVLVLAARDLSEQWSLVEESSLCRLPCPYPVFCLRTVKTLLSLRFYEHSRCYFNLLVDIILNFTVMWCCFKTGVVLY